MAPSLTNGCINKILNGEEVPNPVIQILNYKKPCTDKYSLLISDGVTGYPFVTMDTDLNKMVERREIQKFIVVRVDDYFCQSVPNDHTIIILCELTVLASGKEINKRLGNPVIVTRNSSTTIPLKTEANEAVYTSPKPLFQPSKNFTTEPEAGTISDTEMNKFLNLESCTMAPSLTSGSINKILNSEDVSNPVIQILGCKKCPGTEQKNERYRLLISDGVTSYSFATLGTQLNHMVANKELEKFTVVRVDKYVCNQVQTDLKVIFLLSLTVLAPADEVNEKLGNPINSTTATPSENGANGTIPTAAKPLFQPAKNFTTEPEAGTISDTEMIKFLNLESYTMVPSLSTGSINKILNGEGMPNPVIQILGCKKCPGTEQKNERYRLLISDGVTGYSFTTLGTQLNHMVANKELEKFTVIRVDKFVCNQVQTDRKVIFLLNLTVLVPGDEIDRTLGNPLCLNIVPSNLTPSEKKINGTVHT